jgi:uncharacterized repeat protein (TIGR03843 family)
VLQAQDSLGRPVDLVHADDERLARMAVFDAVIDNADRKGGHVLQATAGLIWGVDHGLSFNPEPKLRTVLWGWQGQPLPTDALAVLDRLRTALQPGQGLAQSLTDHLSPHEIAVTADRVATLATAGTFPVPERSGPMIPWPPF